MLTATEATTLEIYEAVISKGLESFVEVGNALMRIRDGRLYRATHGDFKSYCLQRWKLSETHVNRLVSASEVVANVTPIGVTPTNEAQARPLTALDPDEQAEAWQEAVDTAPIDDEGEPVITAKHVKEVVDRRKGGEAKPFSVPKPRPPVVWSEIDNHIHTALNLFERSAMECDQSKVVIGLLQSAREKLAVYLDVVEDIR